MCFASSKSQMSYPIPQDLHVGMFIVRDARVILQWNTLNNSIGNTLPQRFGFLPLISPILKAIAPFDRIILQDYLTLGWTKHLPMGQKLYGKGLTLSS